MASWCGVAPASSVEAWSFPRPCIPRWNCRLICTYLPRLGTQQCCNRFCHQQPHLPPSPLPPLTLRSNHTDVIQLPPLNPQPLINRLLHIRTLRKRILRNHPRGIHQPLRHKPHPVGVTLLLHVFARFADDGVVGVGFEGALAAPL